MNRLSVADPVDGAKGVGPVTGKKLHDAGIHTIEDLLLFFPYRYLDMSTVHTVESLVPGMTATIAAEPVGHKTYRIRKRRMSVLDAAFRDPTGTVHAVWFNQPYMLRQLGAGKRLLLHGRTRLRRSGGGLELLNPRLKLLPEDGDDAPPSGRIVPVYRRFQGLGPSRIRGIIGHILDRDDLDDGEFLPQETLKRHELLGRGEAFRRVHRPERRDLAGEAAVDPEARRRFAFEELLLIEMALASRKRQRSGSGRLPRFKISMKDVDRTLPFALTGAQRRVLNEIAAEMAHGRPMNRFLQGDVGSGKTVVAFLAMKAVADGGGQAVMMAPTEVLAEQHFERFRRMFPAFENLTLLTGSLRAREKQTAREEIASGEGAVIIGTHALIEAGVSFARLCLVVIDEQQRFGVRQRALLLKKGMSPHFLVMTATPIPRSLAMIIYGELDFSVLDEMPPARGRIRTFVRTQEERTAVHRYIAETAKDGGQAYIVHPIIGAEDEEPGAVRAALATAREFGRWFPQIRTAVVHGRLAPDDRIAALKAFEQGGIQVLICTSLVEVGLDNPRATIMCIENAERFGLSQLHQMRGRIGRGAADAVCVLLAGEAATEKALERLSCLVKITDGFEVAEKDLQFRGPGDVAGTRQWGLDILKIADIRVDLRTLMAAKGEATRLLEEGMAAHPALFARIQALFGPETAVPLVG